MMPNITPEYITALTALIVAVTALIKLFQHDGKLNTIEKQTNGQLTDLQSQLASANQRNTQTGRASDPVAPKSPPQA